MLKLFSDNMLHDVDSDTGEDYGVICNGFFVEKVLSDIFTSEETAIVVLYTRGVVKRFELNLKCFTRNSFPEKIIGKGLECRDNKDYFEAIIEYAMESKKQAPMELVYDRLGWCTVCDKRVYLCSRARHGNKVLRNYSFISPEKITPSGTFEAWREGITPFLGRSEVVLALVIGASAAVVPLLKEAGRFSDTIIFAMIGKSGSFKTTMLRMQAGVYGKPEIGDGIIDTMLDTTNYFFTQLGKKTGFIHAIDDISAASDHDFTNELYNISMGRSRGKLNSDSTPKKIETWCTTVVYTGETSIFAQTNHNTGLYARLIEFSFNWLSAEDDINGFYDTINNNYGVALRPLVQYLFELSNEDIIELYSEALSVVQAKIPPKDSVTRRITERFAILIMTLVICAEAWGFELCAQSIMPLLVETYEKNYAVVDPIAIAAESLTEKILTNNHKFLKKSQNYNDPVSAWGIYGNYKQLPCLWIGEGHMEDLAAAAKIQNFKDLRKELADRGFLVRDKSNHYLFEKNINSGHSLFCYGVYTRKGARKPQNELSKNKSAKKASTYHRKNLLADDEE